METLTENGLLRDDEIILRMSFAERAQHILLIMTFAVLIVTGLPLVLSKARFFSWLMPSAAAFHIRGIAHRAAAITLIVDILWYAAYAIFTARGRAHLREMLPRLSDLRDAGRLFGHNLGLTQFLKTKGRFRKFFDKHPAWLFREAPEFGRYSVFEKFEFWSMAWGSLIMIVSGFFIWDADLTIRIFPLWVLDLFVIIHGYEAVLAFLSILIWHMYNVHLNPDVFPMSRIWLNGKITGRELRTHHPLEYKKILEERKKAKGSDEDELSGNDRSRGA